MFARSVGVFGVVRKSWKEEKGKNQRKGKNWKEKERKRKKEKIILGRTTELDSNRDSYSTAQKNDENSNFAA